MVRFLWELWFRIKEKLICPAAEKKKTADGQTLSCSHSTYLCAVVLNYQGRRIFLLRRPLHCVSGVAALGGRRHSLAPPPGRYDCQQVLLFCINWHNNGLSCCASFLQWETGVFVYRILLNVPEQFRCRSPPSFDSPVNHAWIEMEVHNAENQPSGFVSWCL